MLIWGSKGKTKTVSRGQFNCPRCRAPRPYELKRAARYFTLYFIPVFQTSVLGEFVECQVCFTPFTTEVLHYSQGVDEQNRSEAEYLRAIQAISDQMDAGVPVQVAASALVQSGLTQRTAALAVYAATRGEIKQCAACASTFKATLGFCSNCGAPLPPKKRY